MICRDCQNQQHSQCYDVQHQTDYRSCSCQHREGPRESMIETVLEAGEAPTNEG